MNNRHQQGFGYIAAIVVVVVLALLGAAAARLTTTQQTGASQDLLSSRAWQAARAGTEWGLYRALRNNSCAALTTLDLRGETGFAVSVRCTAYVFKEGESAENVPQSKTVFTIDAIACNAASCPDQSSNAAKVEYTERRRVVTTCSLNSAGGTPTGAAC